MTRLPISVCMISAAEAHRIGRALASVAEWTSEIIVVLNHDANDGTDQIAAQFGAKVFREPWKGFIGQKQSAVGKSTQPWLLGLDADEAISEELRGEILATLGDDGQAARFHAYSFPRRSFYCGRWMRHGDWYPDRKIRLWQRGVGRVGGVEPHETLLVDCPVGKLRRDLLHFSNESIDRQLAKIAPYSESFVQHCLKNERRPSALDLAVRPFWRFFRAYVLRLGFLDGWPGYYVAWVSAFSTVTRYAKVREARLSQKGPP